MVDFQSRDTRRGVSGGDSDDEREAPDEPDEAPEGDGTAAEPDEGDAETTPDEASTDDATAEAVSDTDAETVPDAGSHDDPEAATGDTDADLTSESPDAGTDEAATADAATNPEPEREDRGAPAAGSKVAGGAPDATASPTPDVTPVDVAVVTVGTTTGQGEDPTGETVERALTDAGHAVTARERLQGDYDGVQQAVDRLVGRGDVDVVVTAGGVGIAAGETTIEAVHPLFEKALPGFGEVYRTLLFEHIGTGIVAVRATAGVADGTPVFCLPADGEAAALGIEEIVATEAPELVAHLRG